MKIIPIRSKIIVKSDPVDFIWGLSAGFDTGEGEGISEGFSDTGVEAAGKDTTLESDELSSDEDWVEVWSDSAGFTILVSVIVSSSSFSEELSFDLMLPTSAALLMESELSVSEVGTPWMDSVESGEVSEVSCLTGACRLTACVTGEVFFDDVGSKIEQRRVEKGLYWSGVQVGAEHPVSAALYTRRLSATPKPKARDILIKKHTNNKGQVVSRKYIKHT